jgi:hypothetical protein
LRREEKFCPDTPYCGHLQGRNLSVMSTRFLAFAVVCVLPPANVALADDIFGHQPAPSAVVTCHFNGAERGCSRFQGYVVVHRHSNPSDAIATSAENEPVLRAERLYLPVGSENER